MFIKRYYFLAPTHLEEKNELPKITICSKVLTMNETETRQNAVGKQRSRAFQRYIAELRTRSRSKVMKKNVILGPRLTLRLPSYFGLFCCLFSDTSPERSRDAPDPHPRGLQTRFDAIFVDFGVILGWIWARILSPEKGEFRGKILQRSCKQSCRRLGLPHPQAQTLRVRRSRASVLNK